MQAVAGLEIFCFFVFLFSVFFYARDDFMLLRKNISLHTVYNSAFLVALGSLFTARLFFVVLHFRPLYLNPLVFLAFPYFPGLDTLGGLFGGYIVLSILAASQKLPFARLSDIQALAFLNTLLVWHLFLIVYLVVIKKISMIDLLILGVLMLIRILLSSLGKKMKEGSSGLLIVSLIAVPLAIAAYFNKDMLSLIESGVFFVLTFVLFLKHQIKFFSFSKK